jgi:polyvinyl alcohol dehydrogenase (cytochrome)
LAAVDLKTGKVIWQTSMAQKGYTCGAIWCSTPAVDPKRGLVYVTTDNNYATPKEVTDCQESGKRDCLPRDDHIGLFCGARSQDGCHQVGDPRGAV